MAKCFNLNSQRTSREQIEGLPFRRFTDTNLKSIPQKSVESIYKLQKNTYFQDLMKKDGLGSKKRTDEKNLKTIKAPSRPLDLMVFTRKNAIVIENGNGLAMSPKQAASVRNMGGSPAYSRPSHKKISINSSKGEANTKDNLRLKVMELEKKLKIYEKASKTVRADASDDFMKRKRSSKNFSTQFVPPPALTMYNTKNDKTGMYIDLDNSYAENRSKYDFPGSATSISRPVFEPDQSLTAKITQPRSIEAELSKLRDRVKSLVNKDLRIIQAFNNTGL